MHKPPSNPPPSTSECGRLTPGDTVGPYVIAGALGEGAMGTVYRARRGETGEVVALKTITESLANDQPSRRRFLHEIRAATAVKHNHLVSLLDAGEWCGGRYIVMRYVDGRSLEQRIQGEGRLPISDVVGIAIQIGSALDALHSAHLVHRDVKPANIMLASDGSANLTDFGLAKGPEFSSLTQAGTLLGTLGYLAPERIRGEPASPTSDIYALGCVVYEALAGRPPFGGRSFMQVGWAILRQDPPVACLQRDDAPRHLPAAALLALAKDPAARPQTAGAYTRMLAMATRSG